MPKYIIIFLVILMTFFGIHNVTTDIQTASAMKNMEYSDYLSSATFDAVKEMKKHSVNNVFMSDVSDRERVVRAFFNSLAMDFGFDTNEDLTMLRMYVPVVVLVDTNGYYVCYNVKYEDSSGKIHLKPAITEINTWSKKADNYLVRYGLGEQVTVTDITKGTVKTGSWDDVFTGLLSGSALDDAKAAAGFDNKNKFIETRNYAIIPKIQDTVEYYINNHNEVASQLQSDYVFDMPITSDDEWVRALEHPTVIAFMQGMRINNAKDFLNIYALSGGEVRKSDPVVFKETEVGSSTLKQYTQDKEALMAGSDQKGYYANDKIVALNNDELIHNDEPDSSGSTAKTIPHHHWGSPLLGTGCYIVPVYHAHTTACYVPKYHHHTSSCFADVIHYHTTDCYEYVWHHHSGNTTSGGGCYSKPVYHVHSSTCYYDGNTLDSENKCKLGKTTEDVDHYELNCDYWDMDNLTASQAQLLDDSYILNTVSSLPDYISASAEEKAQIYDDYKESLKSYVYGRCVETSRLICGKENGDNEGRAAVCGKNEGEQSGYELGCGMTGSIDHYDIGCGYAEGELLTEAEAARANE